MLRCDNATNFVGAKNELAKSFSEIEPGVVRCLGQKFIQRFAGESAVLIQQVVDEAGCEHG